LVILTLCLPQKSLRRSDFLLVDAIILNRVAILDSIFGHV
jgi:hypothetical protein